MPLSRRRILLSIVALAALSRVLYLLAFRDDVFAEIPIHDARVYFDRATGAVPEMGAFHQAPLYPMLLRLLFRATGPSSFAAFVVQALLGLGIVLVVSRIASRAYGPAAGAAAALLATLYGTFVFFETKLLPATLAVALAALLVERMQAADAGRSDFGWAIPGVVLGLAALTNPGFLLLAPVVGLWIALQGGRSVRSRASRIALCVAAMCVVVLPVTLRNHRASGEWVLVSTNGGITFYQGNNPNAVGVFAAPEGFTGRIATQREESRAHAEQESGKRMTEAQVSSFWFRRGLAFLASDPVHAAALCGRKLLLALASEEQPLEYNRGLDDNPARFLAPLPFGVVLALAALRPGRRRAVARPRAETPVLLLLATQLALLLVFFVSSRYRLPAMPALLAVAGFGVVELWSARRSLRPWTIVALVAAASLTYVPFAQPDLRRFQLAMSWADRGAALSAAKRLDDAAAAYRRSVELAPGVAQGWLELGAIAFRQDHLEEAEHAFSEAHRLAPTEPSAANNLLGTRLRLGKTREAIETYRDLTARGTPVDPRLAAWIRDVSGSDRPALP
jgi:4-amino-4-deoxy-L-arabinose transferase-like glycosyltransferase